MPPACINLINIEVTILKTAHIALGNVVWQIYKVSTRNIIQHHTTMALKEIPSSFNPTGCFIEQIKLKGMILSSFTHTLPFGNA